MQFRSTVHEMCDDMKNSILGRKIMQLKMKRFPFNVFKKLWSGQSK